MAIVTPTKPASKTTLLLRGLKLYQFGFLKVFFLSLTLSVLTFIPRLIIFTTGRPLFSAGEPISFFQLSLVLLDIICLIYFTAILWRLHCINTGMRESLLEDLKVATKKIPHIIIAVLLQGIILTLIGLTIFSFYYFLNIKQYVMVTNPFAIVLLCLPLVIQFALIVFILILFYFYLPLILTENRGALAALRKSAHLVWTHWWTTFWVQITPWFVYLLTLILIKYVAHINIHIYYFPTNHEPLIAIYLHIILFALFIPWVAATMLVQLRDLELRAQRKLVMQTATM